MEQTNKPKAKRRLKSLDFSGEGSALALVGPSVGGPANGILTLITKSKKNVSEEFLKKASQVTVTLEITEYLSRFFDIWYEDAEILARSLGFTTAEMDRAEEDENEPWDYNKYLEEKVSSIKVMKSLYDSDNIEKAILDLSEEDYLQVLQDQEIVEKAFVEIDKACAGKGKKPVKKNSTANAEDTSTNVDVEKVEVKTSVVKNKNKEKSMTKEVEVIEKSQFEAIQKQLAENQAELQKALDLVKQFEAEKKEAIAKARKEQISKACGKHAEVIFKAVGECEEETFVEVVKALAEMQELIEKSALFKEQGASVSDGEVNEESSLAKVIKAKYSKQQ